MSNLRTWQVYADENFLGYVYEPDEESARLTARKKWGAPKTVWGVDKYTVKKIKQLRK
jgi:hypothetical protein